MKFTLLVNPNTNWQQAIAHALKLCRAIAMQGHQLNTVFFFGHAVQIIENKTLQLQWLELTKTNHTNLLVCRTMIEKLQLQPQLITEFQIVGLGSLTDSILQSNQVLEIC